MHDITQFLTEVGVMSGYLSDAVILYAGCNKLKVHYYAHRFMLLNRVENLLLFTDLVLAAELGKTLLERNKELEKQLVQSQRENSDHLVEIDVSPQSRP